MKKQTETSIDVGSTPVTDPWRVLESLSVQGLFIVGLAIVMAAADGRVFVAGVQFDQDQLSAIGSMFMIFAWFYNMADLDRR